MTLTASPAPIGLACDTDAKLSRSQAIAIRAAGFLAVGRYLPLPRNNAAADIDATELASLTSAGLAVWLVQHVRARPPGAAGWNPADHSGAEDALIAVARAKASGYPPCCHIFLDLEDISGTGPATKTFAEAWAATVRVAGYSAGIYCGFDNPLDAQGLYLLHGPNSYWTDAANRRVVTRGCAIQQRAETTVAGVRIDPDDIAPDELGELPIFCSSAPTAIT